MSDLRCSWHNLSAVPAVTIYGGRALCQECFDRESPQMYTEQQLEQLLQLLSAPAPELELTPLCPLCSAPSVAVKETSISKTDQAE